MEIQKIRLVHLSTNRGCYRYAALGVRMPRTPSLASLLAGMPQTTPGLATRSDWQAFKIQEKD